MPSVLALSEYHQSVLEFTQYSTLFLLLPSSISRIQWFSEDFCAPHLANAFSNTDPTVSH